jgi:cathepsin L
MWAIKKASCSICPNKTSSSVAQPATAARAATRAWHITTKQVGAFNKEEDYQYLVIDVIPCHFNATNALSEITDFAQVNCNEDDLGQAVAFHGRVGIAIDASRKSFKLSKGGMYNDPNCSSTRLDHQVLLTG